MDEETGGHAVEEQVSADGETGGRAGSVSIIMMSGGLAQSCSSRERA